MRRRGRRARGRGERWTAVTRKRRRWMRRRRRWETLLW